MGDVWKYVYFLADVIQSEKLNNLYHILYV